MPDLKVLEPQLVSGEPEGAGDKSQKVVSFDKYEDVLGMMETVANLIDQGEYGEKPIIAIIVRKSKETEPEDNTCRVMTWAAGPGAADADVVYRLLGQGMRFVEWMDGIGKRP